MKISSPRFLNVGSSEILNTEFPACLEKKTDPEQRVGVNHNKESQTVFLFPEVSFYFIFNLFIIYYFDNCCKVFVSPSFWLHSFHLFMFFRTL